MIPRIFLEVSILDSWLVILSHLSNSEEALTYVESGRAKGKVVIKVTWL